METNGGKNAPIPVQANSSMKPLVLKYKSWKKKSGQAKPRYTRGLKEIQLLEGDAANVAKKAARALARSVEVYDKKRGKSARKRRDGALRDYLQNSAHATSTFLKESSDIPIDLAESARRLSIRKSVRKSLRRLSKRLTIWPV